MKYSSVTAKQPVFKQRFENPPRFSKYAEIKLNLTDIFLIYITYLVSKKPEPTNNGNTNNTNLEALLHDYSLISGHCKRRSLVRLCVYLSNIFLEAADWIYLHLPSPVLELQAVPSTGTSSLVKPTERLARYPAPDPAQ